MSKARVIEILDALMEADRRDIEDYNNQVSWLGYQVDRRLSLTAFRLNRLAGGVIEALRELALDNTSRLPDDASTPNGLAKGG